MTTPLHLVVSLWIHDGRVAEFEAFERAAARLMARYGGAIERAVRVAGGNGPDTPFEVHVVSFPGQEAFDAYRADREVAALAVGRTVAIAKTVVLVGVPAPPYVG